jgi:hypothetical protein
MIAWVLISKLDTQHSTVKWRFNPNREIAIQNWKKFQLKAVQF